jgi:hypothetical protein
MAKVKLTPLTEALRGRIGGLVIREIRGKLYASYRPNSPESPASEDQTTHRSKFAHAAMYAKGAAKDPITGPLYRREAGGLKTAYGVAVSDYFRFPEIAEPDFSNYRGVAGGRISVTVADAIQVRSVVVELRSPNEVVVESGRAEWVGSTWQYLATVDAPPGEDLSVTVTASDYPGNVSTRTDLYRPAS